MSRFQPNNPHFRLAAAAVFDARPAMRTLGLSIARLEAAEGQLLMENPVASMA